MQPAEPLAQRLALLAPRQQGQPVLAKRLDDRLVGVGPGRRRQQPLGEHDGAEPLRLAHPHRSLLEIEQRFPAPLDPPAERRADVFLRDGRRRDDACILRLALQIRDDQEFLRRQRIGGIDHCAAPVRQHETPALAPRHRHAIRPCMDEQGAGAHAALFG